MCISVLSYMEQLKKEVTPEVTRSLWQQGGLAFLNEPQIAEQKHIYGLLTQKLFGGECKSSSSYQNL